MGIIRNGFGGNISGKVGNIVFYTLNGKQVARTIGKITANPTVPQLQCRQGMAVINIFIKHVAAFINVGFQLLAKGTTRTPNNMAVAYNKRNALQGTYPNVVIAYDKVLVTQGSMWGAIEPSVEMTLQGLDFSWSCPASVTWPRVNDQVMVLVYFPVIKKVVYILSGDWRSNCATSLALQSNLLNEYMEVYISFIAENRKNIANSTYLGSFNKP
ncbi:DUF6266 family protein [Pedobacter nyackensis]|uniref:Uncharacterized protein n=1 Tax=Pedobacter nyackensis TaxID=475255 RepID=A0A1W2A135_9SPHI|nr:DUF6266 family protein [Pedobacter nyackensis]SMC54131.1 hypothetical protein SAMN04488101_101220 [Pedobacter nyackensis]